MPNAEAKVATISPTSLGAILLALAIPLSLVAANGAKATAPEKSQPPEAAPTSTPSSPLDPCQERFFSPFEELLDLARLPRSAAARDEDLEFGARLANTNALLRQALGPNLQVEPLVATLPDPIDSGHGYLFDTALQAIRLGVERAGSSSYRDGSWLPWNDALTSEKEKVASEACRTVLPGLITFRGGTIESPRLTVVLLVGETPTTGVHRKALWRALEVADQFTPPRVKSVLSVLGPTFSGGAVSLQQTLQAYVASRNGPTWTRIRVITGSASGSAVGQVMKSAFTPRAGCTKRHLGPGCRPRRPLPEVEFSMTTLPEARLQCSYLWFVAKSRTLPSLWPLVCPKPRSKNVEPSLWSRSCPTPDSPSSLAAPAKNERPTAVYLNDVALLHESGTEFGSNDDPTVAADPKKFDCGYRPGVALSFPANIAALRDAYEDMDRKGATRQELVARRTNLEVSLREARQPLGMDGEPSAKTTYARDVSLTRVLTAIRRTSIRHVAIQATDIADAIFLARKVRDVAPDVRLAFLNADVLLLHQAFHKDLFGSLVVTAYPFLGSSDFRSSVLPGRATPPREGFENAAAQGISNAVRALLGAKAEHLQDYQWLGNQAHNGSPPAMPITLPVWIAAVGSDAFVPLSLQPSDANAESDLVQGRLPSERARSKQIIRNAVLVQEANVLEPKLWRFLLAATLLAFVIDCCAQRRGKMTLSTAPFPPRLDLTNEREGDEAIGRTKWKLYACIRTFVLGMGFAYLVVFWCANRILSNGWPTQYTGAWALESCLALGLLVVVGRLLWSFRDFLIDYVEFGKSAQSISLAVYAARAGAGASRAVNAAWCRALGRPAQSAEPPRSTADFGVSGSRRTRPPTPPSPDTDPMDWWDLASQPFGLARADARISPAKLSFAQLRVLTTLTSCLAVTFIGLQCWAIHSGVGFRGEAASVVSSLLVKRTLPLVGSISPAAPSLLCLCVIYVWACGRMARLRLVHGLSRLSPADGIADLVSTPVRLVLFPNHSYRRDCDESFTRVERRAINAIVRPITGPTCVSALALAMALPLALFWLSRLSTLETAPATWLLYFEFLLCGTLIASTLIQLVQYWHALELLLKNIRQHRLGNCFGHVAPFVKDSLHDQLTRTPNDVMRFAATAYQFEELMRLAPRKSQLESELQEDLEQDRGALERARAAAVSASSSRDRQRAARTESELGAALVLGAQHAMRVLTACWDGQRPFMPMGPRSLRSNVRIDMPGTQRAPELPSTPPVMGNILRRPSEPSRVEVRASAGAPPPSSRGSALASQVPILLPSPPGVAAEAVDHVASSNSSLPPDSEVDGALSSVLDTLTKEERRWTREAQQFAATVVTLLLNRHVRQFQIFVSTLLGSTLLLMLAALSYPFEPHRLLLTWIWGLMLSAVGVGLWIYVELDRNSLLSGIASTTTGQVTLNSELVKRVLLWGVVPLAAAASAEYPDLSNAVIQFIAPFTGR